MTEQIIRLRSTEDGKVKKYLEMHTHMLYERPGSAAHTHLHERGIQRHEICTVLQPGYDSKPALLVEAQRADAARHCRLGSALQLVCRLQASSYGFRTSFIYKAKLHSGNNRCPVC